MNADDLKIAVFQPVAPGKSVHAERKQFLEISVSDEEVYLYCINTEHRE